MSGKVGWPLGKPRSEETRKKMSERMRMRWTDPAYRERQATIPHCARGPRDRRGEPRSAATTKRSARLLVQGLLRKR
jgi:NUMOD3 motif